MKVGQSTHLGVLTSRIDHNGLELGEALIDASPTTLLHQWFRDTSTLLAKQYTWGSVETSGRCHYQWLGSTWQWTRSTVLWWREASHWLMWHRGLEG